MEEATSSGRWLGVPATALVGGRAVVDAGDREIVVLQVDGALHAERGGFEESMHGFVSGFSVDSAQAPEFKRR